MAFRLVWLFLQFNKELCNLRCRNNHRDNRCNQRNNNSNNSLNNYNNNNNHRNPRFSLKKQSIKQRCARIGWKQTSATMVRNASLRMENTSLYKKSQRISYSKRRIASNSLKLELATMDRDATSCMTREKSQISLQTFSIKRE